MIDFLRLISKDYFKFSRLFQYLYNGCFWRTFSLDIFVENNKFLCNGLKYMVNEVSRMVNRIIASSCLSINVSFSLPHVCTRLVHEISFIIFHVLHQLYLFLGSVVVEILGTVLIAFVCPWKFCASIFLPFSSFWGMNGRWRKEFAQIINT